MCILLFLESYAVIQVVCCFIMPFRYVWIFQNLQKTKNILASIKINKRKGRRFILWRKREQKTSILLNFWNICAITFCVSMWKIESLSFPVCETVPYFVFQPRGSYALQFEIRKDPWQNAWGFFTVSALQAEHEFELGLGLVRDIVLSRLKKWEQTNSAWA